MNKIDLDKALRAFEKKCPIKKTNKSKSSLDSFVNSIEKQLDKLEKR